MKCLLLSAVCFVGLSLKAQVFQDHFGAGQDNGISVSSSSQSNGTDHQNTINGLGLDQHLKDASRFLGQSTLGVDYETIEEVAAIGPAMWIEQQFEAPMVSYRDTTQMIWEHFIDEYVDEWGEDQVIGNDVIEFAISPNGNGSAGIEMFEQGDIFNEALSNTASSLLNQQYTDIFKQTYRDRVLNSQAQHEQFSGAIAGVNPFATQFTSENPISNSLHMIAKSIAAQETLGHQRQTYFLTFGGWDHHDELLNNQAGMLAIVSQALSEFQAAMEEINMADCVTTFTISDFARTLTSNGNGTDHGWGGNTIVMGGAVNGGQIYGQYPNLALGADLEVGNGVILPSL